MKLTAAQHFMSSTELIENLKHNFKSEIPIKEVKMEKSTAISAGQIITVVLTIAIISYQLVQIHKRREAVIDSKKSILEKE